MPWTWEERPTCTYSNLCLPIEKLSTIWWSRGKKEKEKRVSKLLFLGGGNLREDMAIGLYMLNLVISVY